MPKRNFRTLQLKRSTHAKLKQMSERREREGAENYTMAAIVSEFINKQHKKECK